MATRDRPRPVDLLPTSDSAMVRWSVDVQKSSGDDVKFQHNWFLAELFRSQGRWRLTAGFSFGGSQLRFALSIKKSLLEVVA